MLATKNVLRFLTNAIWAPAVLIAAGAGLPADASSNDGAKFDPYRAVYDMTRGGKPWASAVVTLTPMRYQGRDAWRHSIALRFKDETVLDETIFLREDFRLVGKLINTGFGDDLGWNFYAVRDGLLRGAQIFADARAPVILDEAVPEDASGAAAFKLTAGGLSEGKTLTQKGADAGVSYDVALTVGPRETVATSSGEKIGAWRVERESSLQPDTSSFIWLSEKPPYLIAQEAPAQEIKWLLREFVLFDNE